MKEIIDEEMVGMSQLEPRLSLLKQPADSLHDRSYQTLGLIFFFWSAMTRSGEEVAAIPRNPHLQIIVLLQLCCGSSRIKERRY
jgi:hypothetical protein